MLTKECRSVTKKNCKYTCSLTAMPTFCLKQTFLLKNSVFYDVHHSLKTVHFSFIIGNFQLKSFNEDVVFWRKNYPHFEDPLKLQTCVCVL